MLEFPQNQRVLTYVEYEALGYTLLDDFRAPSGSYATYGSIDLNPFDLAYRADTKQEFYIDAAKATGELAIAYLTGGGNALFRTSIRLLNELVIQD